MLKFEVCCGINCGNENLKVNGHILLGHLGIKQEGGAKIEVEEIGCSGNCSKKPVVFVNGELHAQMITEKLDEIIINNK